MRRLAPAAALVLLVATPSAAGVLTVGSGASVDLDTGSLDLGCADLSIAGTFSAGTVGFQQARDVTVETGGVLNGESATLEYTGVWDPSAGTFNAGTSDVSCVDGCGQTSCTLLGSTTFSSLSANTSLSPICR